MAGYSKYNILVIDDDTALLKTYNSILRREYNPRLTSSPQEGLNIIQKEDIHLVLLDLRMPDMDGLEVLSKIKTIDSEIDVVMVTAVTDTATAVKAIKLGAYEYITKPIDVDELLHLVGNILEKRSLAKENYYLRQRLEESDIYAGLMVGRSEGMRQILQMVDKVAPADSAVFICGESGTGKELIAKSIHLKSKRALEPFVVVNCAAIPENLLESELFGHEKGAFTGAEERRTGKFELADEGTIFLDEIGCMPTSMQAKILRVLQEKVVERVGGEKPIAVDVRLISATNMDPKTAIKDGKFREDLFYRLNVIPLLLPPLRERKEDIPLLAEHFLAEFNKQLNRQIKGFSKEAMDLLFKYDWPGNIRELRNIIERAVALSNNEHITESDITLPQVPSISLPLKDAVSDFEKEYIRRVLASTGGNQTKAAEILGIHRTTLIVKMNALGIK